MSPDQFSLMLVDPNPSLCAELEIQFRGVSIARVVCGRFEDLDEFDCLVSPANSFGLMDGGVDAAIIAYFGNEVQRRVQERILREYRGEQPVGTSFIVSTCNAIHPFLAHTPTMRAPETIAGTDAVYRAMWAMLLAVWKHNQSGGQPIRTVTCPGLGTATGQVPHRSAATQMAAACWHFLNPPEAISWKHARAMQLSVEIAVAGLVPTCIEAKL